ncbi:MAG: DUF4120 domain-containing protein [Dysgonamonadaceae bacterium]|nr:DUF4120 domain-containing protein [Dysgonamonadaceae bacterium]
MERRRTVKIKCEEELRKALEFAENSGDKTLKECINHLKAWEHNRSYPCLIYLYADHAPYSFLFRQILIDGSEGIVGGILYHGTPDNSGAFQIKASKGWQIHT